MILQSIEILMVLYRRGLIARESFSEHREIIRRIDPRAVLDLVEKSRTYLRADIFQLLVFLTIITTEMSEAVLSLPKTDPHREGKLKALNALVGYSSVMLALSLRGNEELVLQERVGNESLAAVVYEMPMECKEACVTYVIAHIEYAFDSGVPLRENEVALTEAFDLYGEAIQALRLFCDRLFGNIFDVHSLDEFKRIAFPNPPMNDATDATFPSGSTDGKRSCQTCNVRKPSDELQTCARCHSVYYCSRECQKADWKPRHKLECKSASAGETQASS